jgi:predicted RNA-binding protein YlxR (DUF448 family)
VVKKRKQQRTCIGCQIKKPKKELIRLIVSQNKKLVFAKTGGRGLYFCLKEQGLINKDCFQLANKKRNFNYDFPKKENKKNQNQKTKKSKKSFSKTD